MFVSFFTRIYIYYSKTNSLSLGGGCWGSLDSFPGELPNEIAVEGETFRLADAVTFGEIRIGLVVVVTFEMLLLLLTLSPPVLLEREGLDGWMGGCVFS